MTKTQPVMRKNLKLRLLSRPRISTLIALITVLYAFSSCQKQTGDVNVREEGLAQKLFSTQTVQDEDIKAMAGGVKSIRIWALN
jgi:hypothetical protein